MKTPSFVFVLLLFAFVGCEKPDPKPKPEEENILTKITDPVFLAYCENAMNNEQEFYFFDLGYFSHSPWDTDGNGKLSCAEAAAVQAISLDGYDKEDNGKVTSLSGLEYFTGLLLVDCGHNLITELDMSKNTALIYLYCMENRLVDLDVSKNGELEYLECSFNSLPLLDVSHNLKLTYLYCHDNKLVSLDISDNTALEKLIFSNNPGDGLQFIIKAWFDNDSCPESFPTEQWGYEGRQIYIQYQNVK